MISDKPVAIIIGASRGIGRQIAISLAEAGYATVISSKSDQPPSKDAPFPPDPNSSASTIHTVSLEIQARGGTALPVAVDTRDPASIKHLFDVSGHHFGRLDVLVYNAGAIWWSSVANTSFKRFNLMQEVNVEGLYAAVQESLPWFEKGGWKGRVIVVSPPIYSRFFRGKTAYAMGKVGMSVLTKGLAMDWTREGKTEMAITSIWPASAIESAATQKNAHDDTESRKDLRTALIFSDAILAMLRAEPEVVNGLLDTDEDFLRRTTGIMDFSKYSLIPGSQPRRIMPAEFPTLEVAEQDDEGRRMDSAKFRAAKL